MESHNKNIYAAYKAVNSRSGLDELQHWKYIKREKVNGKWRYYYDVGENERREAGNALSKVRDAASNAGFHKKRYDEIKSKIDSGEYFDKDNGNDSILKPYRDNYLKALKDYNEAKVQAKKAQEVYAKTPLSKIENTKAKVDAGKKSVAKFLKNVKETTIDTINSSAVKGKNWFENLLKNR